MNISFTEYLNEQLLNESGLSTQKVTIDYLNEHCSKALWMAQHDTPIWRGDDSVASTVSQNGGMSVVNTLRSTRKSANTENYYTLIFDYIFSNSMTRFPLRSNSIICSTAQYTADSYGTSMAVIPTDNAKIGFVDADDIWHIPLPEIDYQLDQLNGMFKYYGIQEDINSIKKWFNDKTLKLPPDSEGAKLRKLFPSFDKLIDFYKQIITSNFKTYTSSNVPMTGNNELWVGGDVVLIDDNFWQNHIKHGSDVTKWELK